MQKFQDVLDGKGTLDEFTSEELVAFNAFARAAAKEEEGKVAGLRGAKRAEEERVATAKAEADRLESSAKAEREKNQPQTPEMKQFREEQLLKAKNRLFSSVKLTEEERALVEDKFKRLDTGKLDSDLIYEDLLSAVAAAKPNDYMTLSNERSLAEQEAAEELARQAAMGNNPPSEGEKKKYSDAVVKYAKDTGISLEDAKRQVEQGTKRVFK